MNPTQKTSMRRSVLLPGESYADFQKAMATAKVSGTPESEFRWRRLSANGWTQELETQFINNLQICGKYAQLGPTS